MAVDVIVHYPEGQKARQELAKKAAEVHAQTVVELVKSMALPAGQKIRLIGAIKDGKAK